MLRLSRTNIPCSITFPNIKDIDLSALSNGIDDFPSRDNLYTTDKLVSHSNLRLHRLLNTLAPPKTWSVSFAHSAPWFTQALCQLKAKGCHLEHLYVKTGLAVHKEMYHDHIQYKDAISSAKTTYYSTLIRTVHDLLQCKIENIHQTLTASNNSTPSLHSLPTLLSSPLASFKLPTVSEITRLILKKQIIHLPVRPPASLPPHLYSIAFCNSLIAFFNQKIRIA